MPNDVVWLRLGDQGDYQPFTTLDDATDALRDAGVTTIDRYRQYGVSAPGYRGDDYISLYWGPNPHDGSAEPARELTDAELAQVNDKLSRPE